MGSIRYKVFNVFSRSREEGWYTLRNISRDSIYLCRLHGGRGHIHDPFGLSIMDNQKKKGTTQKKGAPKKLHLGTTREAWWTEILHIAFLLGRFTSDNLSSIHKNNSSRPHNTHRLEILTFRKSGSNNRAKTQTKTCILWSICGWLLVPSLGLIHQSPIGPSIS